MSLGRSSDDPARTELSFADTAAAVGGRVGFAILRRLHDIGPGTSRQLLEVTKDLGTTSQNAMNKILKRLQRHNFVTPVSTDGAREYAITTDGANAVRALRLSARGIAGALQSRRMVLIRNNAGRRASIINAIGDDASTTTFDAEGDYQVVVVCESELAHVREMEERIRRVGGAARTVRLDQAIGT